VTCWIRNASKEINSLNKCICDARVGLQKYLACPDACCCRNCWINCPTCIWAVFAGLLRCIRIRGPDPGRGSKRF